MARTGTPVIPIYYSPAPSVVCDRALIGPAFFPANALADIKESGLCAGHQIYQPSRRAGIVTPIRLPLFRNSTPAFLNALRTAAWLGGERGKRLVSKLCIVLYDRPEASPRSACVPPKNARAGLTCSTLKVGMVRS